MAQSNHHRLDSPAGELQRPARRHCGGGSHPHRDPSALARFDLAITRLPVSATDEPRFIRIRVCVRQARP